MELLEPVEVDAQESDRFQKIVTVLIMLTTILGAVVAFLETDASVHADYSQRQSQVFAIQAMGERLRATQRNQYDIQIFSILNELDRRAWNASAQARALGRVPGVASHAEQYAANASLWQSVSDQIRSLSPLLAEVDGELEEVRFDRMLEESLVPARGRAEWQRAVTREAEVWDSKANDYLAVITILAVALFLFGLSLTLDNDIRAILVGAGVLIAVGAGAWTSGVYARPVPTISGDAIDAYMLGTTALGLGAYDEAIAHFDRAIELDPVLGGAWADRGYTRTFLAGPAAHRAAIADLTEAVRLGVDNAYAHSNLGRLYVGEGDYDRATEHFRAAVADDPSNASRYFELGRAHFLNGDPAAAREAYQEGIALLADAPSFVREAALASASAELRAVITEGNRATATDLERMLAEASAPEGAAAPVAATGTRQGQPSFSDTTTPYRNERLGVSLERPAEWYLLGGEESDSFVAFASRVDDQFFILTSEVVTPTAYSTARERNARLLDEGLEAYRLLYGDLVVEPARTMTLAGRDALASSYTYGEGETARRGVMIAVTAGAGQAYLIRYETLAPEFEAHQSRFDAIVGSLRVP